MLLQWIFETFTPESTPEPGSYVIAEGFEDYVHSLPATGEGGDYQGSTADALIHAGILVPVDGSQAAANDWDW